MLAQTVCASHKIHFSLRYITSEKYNEQKAAFLPPSRVPQNTSYGWTPEDPVRSSSSRAVQSDFFPEHPADFVATYTHFILRTPSQ